MALAIDGSSPAIASIANTGASATTASFTPPAGAMLLVGSISNQNSSGGSFSVASTPSLGAFSQLVLTNAQEAPAAWHYNTVVTSQSYTVTSTRSGGGSNANGMAVYVIVITGQETTAGGQTATANSNNGTPSVSITTTRNGSMIFAASADWADAGLGTAGSNQTILAEHRPGTGNYTGHFWRRDSTVSVGTYTINLTAPTNEDYNLSVVEVREPAAAAGSPRPYRRYGIPAAILTR